MDADPHQKVQPSMIDVAIADRAPNGECRQQRAPHMVLFRNRRAKHRHETIARELGCCASVAPYLGKAGIEKCVDEIAHRLGAETLCQWCRVDDVAKKDGYLFHFAGKRARRFEGLGPGRIGFRRGRLAQPRPVEQRPAVTAKFLLGRVRSPAGWAGGTEWGTTLSAEVHAGRVVSAAMSAPHHTRTRRLLLGCSVAKPDPTAPATRGGRLRPMPRAWPIRRSDGPRRWSRSSQSRNRRPR